MSNFNTLPQPGPHFHTSFTFLFHELILTETEPTRNTETEEDPCNKTVFPTEEHPLFPS